MNEGQVSIHEKFALLQKLFAPTASEGNSSQPIVLALEPFRPEDVKEIQVLSSFNGNITSTPKGGVGESAIYPGQHGVNFMVKSLGWKVSAMLLVNRVDERSGEVIQDLVTVLVLPKLNNET